MGSHRVRVVFLVVCALVLAAMVAPVAAAQDSGGADDQSGDAAILSVVDAGSGSLNARGDRLTLDDVKSRAIWFTDRPSRKTGAFTIPELLRAFFEGQVPPNAAVEFLNADEQHDVAIVELSNPKYDKKADRLIFAVRLLDDAQADLDADTALDDFVSRNDGTIGKSFGATSVFIDSATLGGPNVDPDARFTLKVKNDSDETWNFFTFARAANGDPQLVSLAWFSQYVAPHTVGTFSWGGEDFELMWSRIGSLAPGVVFTPRQTFPADPAGTQPARAGQSGRWAGLTFNSANGLFSFDDGMPILDPPPDSLYIQSDATVANGTASVGIGLDGSPLFARPALTNITALFPTAGLSYFIAAAVSMQAGAALDPVVQTASQVPFPGATSATATFNADHAWTIVPG